MPWAALAVAAVSYYGASKDKDAVNSANKANWAQLQEALGYLGWPGQATYSFTTGATAGGSPGAGRQAFFDAIGGDQGSIELSKYGNALFSNDPAHAAKAKEWLTQHLGPDKFNAAYSAAQQAAGPGSPGTTTTVPTAWGQLNARFNQAEMYAKQSAAALTRGATAANKAIAQTGAGAQQQILRTGEQAFQRGETGLAQSGLLNTSLRSGLARSNRADTNRSLTQLAGQLAPVRAQGQLALGQAQAQGSNMLANISQNRAQMEMQLAMQRISALMGVENVPGPGFLSSIGGAQGLANFGSAIGNYNWGGGSTGWGASDYNAYKQQQAAGWPGSTS